MSRWRLTSDASAELIASLRHQLLLVVLRPSNPQQAVRAITALAALGVHHVGRRDVLPWLEAGVVAVALGSSLRVSEAGELDGEDPLPSLMANLTARSRLKRSV
jgi:2-keto-3-deoxy-6-phosphogluconate aldolase